MTMSDKKYEIKIINAGFYRGGTASLSLALQQLGFGPTWHMMTNNEKLLEKGVDFWNKHKMSQKILNNQYIDFDAWLQEIQCKTIMDAPIALNFERFFKQYPSSRVIVSIRDFEKWYESIIKLCKINDRFLSKCAQALDPFYNFNVTQLRNAYCYKILFDETKKDFVKKKYYDGYIEHVKKIVPENQLLIFNAKNGWKPLCQFLNQPVPKKPYPNINHIKYHSFFIDKFAK
eukprot:UN08509